MYSYEPASEDGDMDTSDDESYSDEGDRNFTIDGSISRGHPVGWQHAWFNATGSTDNVMAEASLHNSVQYGGMPFYPPQDSAGFDPQTRMVSPYSQYAYGYPPWLVTQANGVPWSQHPDIPATVPHPAGFFEVSIPPSDPYYNNNAERNIFTSVPPDPRIHMRPPMLDDSAGYGVAEFPQGYIVTNHDVSLATAPHPNSSERLNGNQQRYRELRLDA
ncbi:hypothetical protein C2E23DRAFT_888259 [Lenzites betulinus]|nr:hypothetical protein C2E23DRAFT_888259 [Lenzites betulinus]